MKLIIDRPIGEKDSFADYFGEPQMCFSGSEMADFLANCTDSEIEIELRSPGGSVEQGLMIYDLLRSSGKKVKTVGYQLHSIASIIFLAGDERLISENATPLLHHPALLPWDLDGRLTANDLEAIAEAISALEGRMMSIYTERMGLSPENAALFTDKLQKEWTMTADDAVMWGLATGKIQTTASAAKVKGLFYSEKAVALKIKTQNKQMDITKTMEELKGLLKEAKALFSGKAKAGSVTTTNETVKVLYFEGDQIEVGKAVFSDEAMTTAAPSSSYEIDGGMTVLVETDERGVSTVTSITEATDSEALKQENAKLKSELEAMKKEKADAEAKAEAAATASKALAVSLEAIQAKVTALEKVIPGDSDPLKRSVDPNQATHEEKKRRVFGKKID